MNGWSKEDLEEMFGDDIIGQMAFVSGCYRHTLSNADPGGWIISDEDLRKFAELIVLECRPWLADDAFEEVKQHFGVQP